MITVPVIMIASNNDFIDRYTSITIPEAKRRYSEQNGKYQATQICKCGKGKIFDSYSVKLCENPTEKKIGLRRIVMKNCTDTAEVRFNIREEYLILLGEVFLLKRTDRRSFVQNRYQKKRGQHSMLLCAYRRSSLRSQALPLPFQARRKV